MRPNPNLEVQRKFRYELDQVRNRHCQRLKFAVLTPALCCVLVLSGCAGLRHAGLSAFDRSVETSSNQSQEQSSQQQRSDSRSLIARDGQRKTAEQSNIALAGHQELVNDHFGGQVISSDPRINFADEAARVLPEFTGQQAVNSQHFSPASQPPPAPAISNLTHSTEVHSLPPGPFGARPMTNVVRARGDRFRQPQQTATELLGAMRAENEKLNRRLRDQKLAYSNLRKELQGERTAHRQTMTNLDRSQSINDQLRKQSAALQVKADRLIAEKTNLKRQSDSALKEIEASLDAVLLQSISRARQTSSPSN